MYQNSNKSTSQELSLILRRQATAQLRHAHVQHLIDNRLSSASLILFILRLVNTLSTGLHHVPAMEIHEANPPSYEKATLVNAWDIIAKYIPSSDLCSAALVCEEWHSIFVPHLWGNPASHFSQENDRVYGECLEQSHRMS